MPASVKQDQFKLAIELLAAERVAYAVDDAFRLAGGRLNRVFQRGLPSTKSGAGEYRRRMQAGVAHQDAIANYWLGKQGDLPAMVEGRFLSDSGLTLDDLDKAWPEVKARGERCVGALIEQTGEPLSPQQAHDLAEGVVMGRREPVLAD